MDYPKTAKHENTRAKEYEDSVLEFSPLGVNT